ncbi:MAG: 50S ribosomal protein L10 [bacterium]|nr:50S ribosomal protein L10 [bacterium]
MSLTRQQKEQRVAEGSQALSEAVSVVFMSYDALGVKDMEELRAKLFEQGIKMRVMPKRLMKLVLDKAKIDFNPVPQAGQMAILWGNDAIAPAKVLNEFAKKRDNIQMVAGIMESKLLSADEVKALALLPGRQELLGQLVGTIAGPIRSFVSVLSGVQRNTVYVLSAIRDQKTA